VRDASLCARSKFLRLEKSLVSTRFFLCEHCVYCSCFCVVTEDCVKTGRKANIWNDFRILYNTVTIFTELGLFICISNIVNSNLSLSELTQVVTLLAYILEVLGSHLGQGHR
jgi:hypothetical protein